MGVVRHDREGVKLELTLIAMAKDGLQEQFCMGFFLEVPMLEKGGDRYSMGAGLKLCWRHGRKHTVGLKPYIFSVL